MCGINGIFDPEHRLADKAGRVRYMNQQMTYRGPDDEGVYDDDLTRLGMRRLSIIDVSGGHQPLFNEDSSLVIVFNGEIYNYVELMCDLKARGHRFTTAGDGETILHLYEEKGVDCLSDLRGMFAFIIWDRRQQRLFAARDRIGIKPLYYTEDKGVLWLSSELKTIIGAAELTPTIRGTALYQFLLYGYAIDQRHTIVEQVKRVLPGEYLVADTAGVIFKRYWTPAFAGNNADELARTDEELREILETAVSIHLRSDVPVGILLSGGVDSSAVAAFAARSGNNYTALCAGYVGNSTHDERTQAHETAEFLGLPYEDIILDAEAYKQQFDQLVQCCDEPVGDWAAMPQWALYAQAQQRGYKVLLSGIGGDEVFFGYPFWNDAGIKMLNLQPQERKSWTGFDDFTTFKQAHYLLDELTNGYSHDLMPQIDQPLYELRDSAPFGPDSVAAMLFGSYLVHNGCYLADRLGMGCSIEVRVPLLDHILIESVFTLPLSNRFQKDNNKILLKQLVKELIPSKVLNAPKRGFTPPQQYLEDLIAVNVAEICNGVLAKEWLNREKVKIVLNRQQTLPWLNRGRRWLGVQRSTIFLFRMLAFERWFNLINTLPSPRF